LNICGVASLRRFFESVFIIDPPKAELKYSILTRQ